MNRKHRTLGVSDSPGGQIQLPFALPIVQPKKGKKKCCRKYKKGKRCKSCPGRR